MLRHYLLTALRGFRRNPLSTAIKLLALSLGLVCMLAAYMIGDYFRQGDAFWAKADRAFVLIQSNTTPDGRPLSSLTAAASPAAAQYLRTDFPELEAAARMDVGRDRVVRRGDRDGVWRINSADPDLLRIFDLPLETGAGEGALDAPRSAVIQTDVADALFGDEDPMGQTIQLSPGFDVTVTGVFREIPRASQLGGGIRTFQILISWETAAEMVLLENPELTAADLEREDWRSFITTTYLLFPEDRSFTAAELNRLLPDFAARRAPADQVIARFEARPVTAVTEMDFNRLTLGVDMGVSVITLFYLFGALTLGVACLDFANLGAADAARRAKEIGLRKTLGARERQVAAQMLFEAGLLAAASLVLVAPLTALLTPILARVAFIDLAPPGPERWDYWLGALGIAAAAALAAGAYPALVLARIRPAFALRMGVRGGGGGVRAALVAVQFAAAAFLAVMVMVMLQQKADLRAAMLTPEGDKLLVIDVEEGAGVMEAFRAELLSHPAIAGFVYDGRPFSRQAGGGNLISASPAPGAPQVQVMGRGVSYGFFTTAGATMLAGRDFAADLDAARVMTSDAPVAIVDRRTAAMLGFTPQQAVGEPVYIAPSGPGAEGRAPLEATIIGVVDEPPLRVTVEGPPNYFYGLNPPGMERDPLVRIARDRIDEGMAHVERVWGRMFPERALDAVFVDELFQGVYQGFNLLNAVFMALAAIAIVVAALGLFGMASFIVQQRRHEIGVRKTLGASSARVLGLMLWDFSKPVVVANLIAWPFAWMAAQAYLGLFVTRVPLTPAPFVIALAASMLVAWAAVGVHAARAARVKPALVLKAE